jgi:hypothetical protein
VAAAERFTLPRSAYAGFRRLILGGLAGAEPQPEDLSKHCSARNPVEVRRNRG